VSNLTNTVTVITGASSGIGAATAKRLAASGSKVVLAARSEDKLIALVEDITKAGGTAAYKVVDVTSPSDLVALADFAEETFGAIDILVNNAGLMLFSYWKDVAVDDWDKMIDTNLRGYLFAIAAILPRMLERGQGHILNMSSVAGHNVGAASGVYSSTKFFISAMTESLRKEVSVSNGIKVSMISPGVIDTGWQDKVDNADGKEAADKLIAGAISPESVADAVAFSLDQPKNIAIGDIIIAPTRQDW
jgi:NADP-dependent 3-hydroxy acid dehydrogenase YdfG